MKIILFSFFLTTLFSLNSATISITELSDEVGFYTLNIGGAPVEFEAPCGSFTCEGLEEAAANMTGAGNAFGVTVTVECCDPCGIPSINPDRIDMTGLDFETVILEIAANQ